MQFGMHIISMCTAERRLCTAPQQTGQQARYSAEVTQVQLGMHVISMHADSRLLQVESRTYREAGVVLGAASGPCVVITAALLVRRRAFLQSNLYLVNLNSSLQHAFRSSGTAHVLLYTT
jgi:hypothetical protein